MYSSLLFCFVSAEGIASSFSRLPMNIMFFLWLTQELQLSNLNVLIHLQNLLHKLCVWFMLIIAINYDYIINYFKLVLWILIYTLLTDRPVLNLIFIYRYRLQWFRNKSIRSSAIKKWNVFFLNNHIYEFSLSTILRNPL